MLLSVMGHSKAPQVNLRPLRTKQMRQRCPRGVRQQRRLRALAHAHWMLLQTVISPAQYPTSVQVTLASFLCSIACKSPATRRAHIAQVHLSGKSPSKAKYSLMSTEIEAHGMLKTFQFKLWCVKRQVYVRLDCTNWSVTAPGRSVARSAQGSGRRCRR